MHLIRLCVALVLMVNVVLADGTGDVRADQRGAAKSATGAQTLIARIDAVLAARWAEAKVRPAPIADDGEFLRRASLDLIGKIPTAAEARDFLDDPSKGKRLALVERLLDSPAYTTRDRNLAPALSARGRYGRCRPAGRGQLRGLAQEKGDRRRGVRSDRP